MNLPRFIYHSPSSLKECIATLADKKNSAQVLAGGSDLLVRMKLRLEAPGSLVSLADIPTLKDIVYRPGKGLTIGAGVTLSLLASDAVIRERCPALADAAGLVATNQIRTVATIGGNILQNTRCRYYNRSPLWGMAVSPCFKRNGGLCHVVPRGKRCFAVYQGDLAPLLIALNASVKIVSKKGAEEAPLESLYSGDGKSPFNNLAGKVVEGLTIPEGSLNMLSAYRKYRLRGGIDFPLAGVAVALKLDNGLVQDLRLCLTGVASRPFTVQGAGDAAKGKPLGRELAREEGKLAYAAAHPLANLEGDPAARRSMIRIMTEDILASFMV
ncbi:MAG TPA: FAD binding domain-containing protein [Syntrophorhabdaceae bacterium]|nr:FAD binding domain-containing protein [Syntrophorhabdaceae bacterium]HQM81520.1 FAD binding domain-containing protein [Syntrophorhabdaceae bacterium]